MTKGFLIVTALLSLSLGGFTAFAGEIVYVKQSSAPAASVLENNNGSVIVRFSVPQVSVYEQYHQAFGSANVFEVPLSSASDAYGAPAVPVIRKGVRIPNTGQVELEILNEEIILLEGYDVSPAQRPRPTCCPDESFEIDQIVYGTDELFPELAAGIDSIEILRDVRVARVNYYPVRFNPVSGQVIITTSVDIKIHFYQDKGPGTNELKRTTDKVTFEYIPFYKELLNYDTNLRTTRDSGQVPSYIFLGSDQTLAAVSELIDWKKRKGFDVHEVTTAETGSSADEIDAWIENAYNTWDNPPLYILLVGDQDVVATPFSSGYMGPTEADHFYGVIGTGNEASIGIGRINQQNSSMDNLTYQAWKIRTYEMEPFVEGNYFNKGMAWGCSDPPPIDGPGYARRWQDILIAGGLDTALGLETDYITGNTLMAHFDDGISLFGLKSHGMQESWVSAQVNASHVASLSNGRKLPFISSIACVTSNFSNYYSISEAWMSEGSIDDSKGAIGLLSWTDYATNEAGTVIEELWHAMFDLDIWHVALGMNYGKTKISYQPDIDHGMIWGDPELAPYTVAEPPQLEVSHGPLGQGQFDLAVTADSTAVEGALVAIVTQGDYEHLDAAYTDSSGEVTLILPEISGDVYVTATHPNMLPYLGESSSGDADTDTDSDTDSDGDSDSDSDSDSDVDSDSDGDSDSDSDSDGDSDSDSDSDGDSDSDSDSDGDSDSDSDGDSDSDSDGDTDGDGDSDSDTDSDINGDNTQEGCSCSAVGNPHGATRFLELMVRIL